ncbi:MAG: hypothetical protein IJ524_05290 [Bacteroidales bacterium]|nr:hypothetical protein [Bacteroidales bacterium]
MTHNQKLDMLLYGLLSRVPQRNTTGSDSSALTFDFLCSALFKDESITPWGVKFLQDRLVGDGYVEMITVNNIQIPNITQKGIKFIQDGGYQRERERLVLQDENVRTTIESNKRSKSAWVVSLISLGLSLIAIVVQIIFR